MRSLLAIIGMGILTPLFPLLLLITGRLFLEARFINTESMQPTLATNDRVLVEKVKSFLKRPYVRGEIVLFYPPPVETGGQDLSWDPEHVLGRLTGLPFFPYEAAFMKRVIGLPGDAIRIVKGQGVYLNGQLLDEHTYVQGAPNYDLNVLGDIGGRTLDGGSIQPYRDRKYAQKPIIVQTGQLFVLGDNRSNSEDSHVFGMVNDDRIVGRVMMRFFPTLKITEAPLYSVHQPVSIHDAR